MTAVLIAAISALGVVLAAVVPALLAHRARGAASTAASTSADVLAVVYRLEGKVDALAGNLGDLADRVAVHEATHAPVPLTAVRRRASR